MSQICFMVMPYGKKPNQSGKGPAIVDFDALWEKALRPLIRELGYEAIRADQDLGALIILEMIERLAVADLVIADVSIPNGNVYYEIGVRHAARDTGCVMIAADWTKPLFDIDQMRRIVYPMPEGDITDATADAILQALKAKDVLTALAKGRSPVFQSLPWYPGEPEEARKRKMNEMVAQLQKFQEDSRAARRAPRKDRAQKALELRDRYQDKVAALPAIALEILYSLRDAGEWQAVLNFIDALPPAIRDHSVVQEQRSLAESKTGDHVKAIGVLEKLIEEHGDSSERRGLLGGRYKKLYEAETDADQKAGYLDQAIDQYTLGMGLDLNDYYPSSNLPRLLRERGNDGDEEAAQTAATVTMLACQRARTRNPGDEWINPTLLGAAFDKGDVPAAKKLVQEIRKNGAAKFHLDSTIPDLKRSVALLKDSNTVAALSGVLADLERLA